MKTVGSLPITTLEQYGIALTGAVGITVQNSTNYPVYKISG
jgi:hypothetical protein